MMEGGGSREDTTEGDMNYKESAKLQRRRTRFGREAPTEQGRSNMGSMSIFPMRISQEIAREGMYMRQSATAQEQASNNDDDAANGASKNMTHVRSSFRHIKECDSSPS